MINTSNIKINSDSTKVDILVETTEGNKFTSLLFWTSENFQNVDDAIDLTDLLEKENHIEDFYITPEDVSLTNFVGLFFLEFTTDEINDEPACQYPENVVTVPVGNFTKYHLCILDNIAAIDIQDCEIIYKGKKECGECQDYLFLMNTMLESLYIATMYGFNEEACRIIENLDELCEDCTCYNKREIDINLSGIYCSTLEDCTVCNVILKY